MISSENALILMLIFVIRINDLPTKRGSILSSGNIRKSLKPIDMFYLIDDCTTLTTTNNPIQHD